MRNALLGEPVADIDVATCGVISPLKALNYLIESLESDIVVMDYRVRGFTRDVKGKKHYIDHKINSIQDYLAKNIKSRYEMLDVNVYQENIFHTKMHLKDFDLDQYLFEEKARGETVRAISIKLSQGAKPGHGGMLPAAKVTAEIAATRHVPMGVDCISPARHSAFSTPLGLLQFVDRMRSLSGGKPAGFKLALGHPWEWFAIAKAMQESGLLPDFIVIDGADKLRELDGIAGITTRVLDVLSNEILLQANEWGGHLAGMASEEMDHPSCIPGEYPQGGYLLLFDPLDGSSNIDVNISVGTIFSVLRAPEGVDPSTDEAFLQPGTAQVAAGYTVYGPSTLLVLTLGYGVHVFTLDREQGSFVLTQRGMTVPEETREFAINMSNKRHWEAPMQQYVADLLCMEVGRPDLVRELGRREELPLTA